jgi:signal peptidase I
MKLWIPALALACALSPLAFIHPVRVSGPSMLPTFENGELHIVLRSWCVGTPARGQIWLAQGPEGPALKRIIGLPGEQVEQRQGWIFVNGQRLSETYVTHPESDSAGPWECGSGYLVMGDNRPESHDGRQWGSLPHSALRGRVF